MDSSQTRRSLENAGFSRRCRSIPSSISKTVTVEGNNSVCGTALNQATTLALRFRLRDSDITSVSMTYIRDDLEFGVSQLDLWSFKASVVLRHCEEKILEARRLRAFK